MKYNKKKGKGGLVGTKRSAAKALTPVKQEIEEVSPKKTDKKAPVVQEKKKKVIDQGKNRNLAKSKTSKT